MSKFKFDRIPPFVERVGNSLIYKNGGEVHYYIPENYFGNQATIEGSYIRLLGSFCYRIIDENGKKSDLRLFNYPSAFLCKPSMIKKEKNIKLEENIRADDYRILIFNKGDQLVSSVFTPQNIDNTTDLFSLHIMTGKIPKGIPYDKLYLYPYESLTLNGAKFNVHTQLMALVYSKLCRDPHDIKNLFRLSKAIDKDPASYIPISIKEIPKYTSPFSAITSENIDDGIISSILLSEDEESGVIQHRENPLEKVMMM